jgi:molybdopterin adenylyltransferase
MRSRANRFSCAVITMSDKGSVGLREDTSGTQLQEMLKEEGYRIQQYLVIPDNVQVIIETLIECVDTKEIDLIVTTGGTGVAPTDVTPEAMNSVLDKEIPGMAEAMRAASLQKTPHAVLARGKVGIRNKSLIINLPGSKKAARENLEVILPALPHALDKIQGGTSDCGS